jgi:cytochrome P450
MVVGVIHTITCPNGSRRRSFVRRFSPERRDQRHNRGSCRGGAHTCIGLRFAELQIKSILHQLLLRYRWSVPEGYRMPVQQAPISKPRDGLPVRFERIH